MKKMLPGQLRVKSIGKQRPLGAPMLQTVTGIYENGQVRLNEHLERKHAKVIVTFLDDDNGLKTLSSIPACFKKPVDVTRIVRLTRDELHER